jgi:hypothetical protein
MKFMKKSLSLSILIIFTTILFQSCNWDNPKYHTFFGYAIGTVKGTTNAVYLLQDDGTTVLLNVMVAKNDSVFDKRYYVEGTVYEQGYGEKGYDVTVEPLNNAYYEVAVKELIFAENVDSISKVSTDGFDFNNNNRSRISQTEKYLNIPLTIYADNADKHTIDYHIDASSEIFDKSDVKVYLTHNANGDTKNNVQAAFRFTSLDLTPIFEHYENGKEFTLTLIYTDLYNQQQTLSLKELGVKK